ncbi:Retrovirus-related Pol polyprotein from transposon TNT 1-94, partial [Stegodyphus mimosarum]
MIIVYVDDILIVCKSEEKIKRLIKYLNEFLEAKDLEVRNYLGINIKRDENKFLLSQKSKIEKLKMMFCPDSHKPSYTPMDTSYPKEEDVSPPVDNTKYRQAIGALLFIATVTRPDINLAVNLLSRKNESPKEKDWKAVLRVIEYLNSTKDICLKIDCDSPPSLSCYTDADYASDLTTRRSTGGNLFFLGNSPIFWSTKRQNCVSLSSTESELISAATAAQELKWILDLLKDFDLPQKLPIKIYEDNKSTIALIKQGKMNTRIKVKSLAFKKAVQLLIFSGTLLSTS